MKTKFSIALISSLLLWSCSGDSSSETVSFIGLSGSPASSRSVVEDAGDWVSMPIDFMDTPTATSDGIFGWSKDDKVGLYVKKGDESVSEAQIEFTAGVPSGTENETVEFTGNLKGLVGTNVFYGVYPYTDASGVTAISYKLPYLGIQLGVGDISNFGKYASMLATPTEYKSSNSTIPTLQFTQLNSILKLNLSISDESPITRVLMSTDGESPLSGDVSVNMTTAADNASFKKLNIVESTWLNEVMLNGIISKVNSSYTVYGIILPGDHIGQHLTFDALTFDASKPAGGSNKLYSGATVGVNFKQAYKYEFSNFLSLTEKTDQVALSNSSSLACGAWMKDARDGKIYKTLAVGNGESAQCWMAENLNVGVMETTSDASDNWTFNTANIQKWCYGDVETNCTSYGGLYEWWEVMSGGNAIKRIFTDAALTTALIGNLQTWNIKYGIKLSACRNYVQGICPDGWHLPSQTEWSTLAADDASLASQFNGLPSGSRVSGGGAFENLGSSSSWWSSTLSSAGKALSRDLSGLNFAESNSVVSAGYSVRCVQNYASTPIAVAVKSNVLSAGRIVTDAKLICPGGSITINSGRDATAVGALPNYKIDYSWYVDGNLLEGETRKTLTLSSLIANRTYKVKRRATTDFAYKETVVLDIVVPATAVVSFSLDCTSVPFGKSVTASPAAYSYVWSHGNTTTKGSTYTPSATHFDAGSTTARVICTASYFGCGTESAVQTLTISTLHAGSISVPSGVKCPGSSITIGSQTAAKIDGTDESLTYSWYVNSVKQANKTGVSLTLNPLVGGVTYSIERHVECSLGSKKTEAVSFTVLPAVEFSLNPTVAKLEEIVTASTTTTNDLSYTWSYGNTDPSVTYTPATSDFGDATGTIKVVCTAILAGCSDASVTDTLRVTLPPIWEDGEYGVAVSIGNLWWAPVNVGYDEDKPYGLLYVWGNNSGYRYVKGKKKIVEGKEWSEGSQGPCPENWYLPTDVDYEILLLAANSPSDEGLPGRWTGRKTPDNAEGRWFGADCETATKKEPGNAIFLPAMGYWFTGLSKVMGGLYWTSTSAHSLVFTEDAAAIGDNTESYGFSVRCVHKQ